MPRISRQKKEETRQKILSVSKKLFLETGYYNTSTNLIAQEVGIAEGTIFNYFTTKADLFLASVSEEYFCITCDDDFQPEMSGDVIDLLNQYIHRRLDRILMLPKKVLIDLTTALMGKVTSKNNIVDELISIDKNYIEKLIEFIRFLQNENLIRDTSPKTLSECIFGIVFMELFVYLNVQSYSKEDAIAGMEEKIIVLMTGHIKT